MATGFIRDSQVLVGLTNEILGQLHVSMRVKHVSDIGAAVFVMMYEGLCGEVLPDVVHRPRNREDEVHNCQVVIDSLSMDVLNTSLSHISGEDIVAGDHFAIGSLLDVFSGLLDFMLDKIGSETSSEHADPSDVKIDDFDDPDLVTPEVIDDILERELGSTYLSQSKNGSASLRKPNKTSNESGDSTAELIKLGNVSREVSGTDHTSDLIALGDSSVQSPAYNGKPATVAKAAKELSLEAHSQSRSGYSADASGTVKSTDASGNSTSDLIRETEDLQKKYAEIHPQAGSPGSKNLRREQTRQAAASSSVALDTSAASSIPLLEPSPVDTAGEFSSLGQGPRQDRLPATLPASGHKAFEPSKTHHTYEGHIHLYHHGVSDKTAAGAPVDPLSASLPLPAATAYGDSDGLSSKFPTAHSGHLLKDSTRTDNLQRATSVAASGVQSERQTNVASGQYDALRSLMKDTVAMSRAAVETSPLREKKTAKTRYKPTDTDEELSDALKSSTSKNRSMSPRSSQSARNTADSALSKLPEQTLAASTGSLNMSDLNGSSTIPKGILSPPRRFQNGSKRKAVTFKARSAEKSRFSDTSTDSSHCHVGTGSGVRNNTLPRSSTAAASKSLPQRKQRTKAATQPESSPKTFRDYLKKYYGHDHPRLRSMSDEELDYRKTSSLPSESETSGGEADVSSSMERHLVDWHDRLRRKARTVQFDDLLDDATPGEIGNLRRKFKHDDYKTRLRKEFLRQLYDDDYDDFHDEVLDSLAKQRQRSSEKEKEYKKKVLTAPKTKHKPAKKYSASTKTSIKARNRTKSSVVQPRKRSVSASPSFARRRPNTNADELLPWLLEEFPYLHLTSETLHNMWRSGAQQVERMSKLEKELGRKKSKQQVQMEEAERRQDVLLKIMKKELAHNHRKREMEERRQQQQQVKAAVRDKRLQSAKCRKYYDEFQVRHRSKMLKKRSREEVMFRNLFKEGLDIQKDRIHELRKYAKEERQRRAKKQEEELSSLENYYKDQFGMLIDSMVRERQDMSLRESAQAKVLDQMKRELRHKMEKEVRSIQDQLWRDEDDAHYRTLDAERLKHDLHRASLQVKL